MALSNERCVTNVLSNSSQWRLRMRNNIKFSLLVSVHLFCFVFTADFFYSCGDEHIFTFNFSAASSFFPIEYFIIQLMCWCFLTAPLGQRLWLFSVASSKGHTIDILEGKLTLCLYFKSKQHLGIESKITKNYGNCLKLCLCWTTKNYETSVVIKRLAVVIYIDAALVYPRGPHEQIQQKKRWVGRGVSKRTLHSPLERLQLLG